MVDDFDFDDDEGSDHQDYDANYFDNGEGDDDSGGEEGESISISTTQDPVAWWRITLDLCSLVTGHISGVELITNRGEQQ